MERENTRKRLFVFAVEGYRVEGAEVQESKCNASLLRAKASAKICRLQIILMQRLLALARQVI